MKEGSLRDFIPPPEEFSAAFGVGSDPSSISAIDACGVILSSLKAVDQRSRDREAALEELRHELKELADLLDNLEERSAPERGKR